MPDERSSHSSPLLHPTGTAEVTSESGHDLRTPFAERRCHLVVLNGPSPGRTLPLASGSTFRVGKAPENDVVLDDDTVSRAHCLIEHDGSAWLIRDLGSRNGTFVDGARIREAFLRSGSTLKVGGVHLRFGMTLAPMQLPPSDRTAMGSLVGRSLVMRELFALLERVAHSGSTVLITGETGTGKGAAARALHEASPRAPGPFVVVDCSAVAPNLIESELFGHERGAFTGAEARRAGALEQAHGGTLFLDELDDLRLDLQPRLLRALEERTFQRVGSNQAHPFDARVIAATKKQLGRLVARKAFREDLYFRLAVFQCELPPLRSRSEDLPLLVDRFVTLLGGRPEAWSALSPEVHQLLLGHAWPGNVRELRNAVERAFTLAGGGNPGLELWQLQGPGAFSAASGANFDLPFKDAKDRMVDDFEREYVRRIMTRARGKVAEAARLAGLDRKHIYNLLHKHGFDPDSFYPDAASQVVTGSGKINPDR